jgi:hypothetical protein
MHHAPALMLTLRPDPLWRNGLRVGGASGLCTALGWLAWHATQVGTPAPGWPMLAVAAVSVIPSLQLLVRSRATTPARTLSWQPAQALWTLQTTTPDAASAPRSGRIDCMVAGQDWLLLRHAGPGIPAAWIPLSRHTHAAEWHALRCAVFSPGTALSPTPHPDE